MPTRSGPPRSAASSRSRPASARPMSRAASSALRAAASGASSSPKSALIPSPTTLSTRPPARSIAAPQTATKRLTHKAVDEEHEVRRQPALGPLGGAAPIGEQHGGLELAALPRVHRPADGRECGRRRREMHHREGRLRPNPAGEPDVRRRADAGEQPGLRTRGRRQRPEPAGNPHAAGRAAAAAAAHRGVRYACDAARLEEREALGDAHGPTAVVGDRYAAVADETGAHRPGEGKAGHEDDPAAHEPAYDRTHEERARLRPGLARERHEPTAGGGIEGAQPRELAAGGGAQECERRKQRGEAGERHLPPGASGSHPEPLERADAALHPDEEQEQAPAQHAVRPDEVREPGAAVLDPEPPMGRRCPGRGGREAPGSPGRGRAGRARSAPCARSAAARGEPVRAPGGGGARAARAGRCPPHGEEPAAPGLQKLERVESERVVQKMARRERDEEEAGSEA